MMKFIVKPSNLEGEATIPGSKSNTTRAVIIATLAEGRSEILNPLPGVDCISTVEVCEKLGAKVKMEEGRWVVDGVGKDNLKSPAGILDVGNSGTTLYIATATAALIKEGYSVLSGDYQICYRPSQPLIDALNDLGATAFSTRDTGTAPIVVKGVIKGGKTHLPGINSQWLSPLLINCPLAEGDTEVTVENLQEKPYIDLTMGWLDLQDIEYKNHDYERFVIRGGQIYKPYKTTIPADWESATFPMVAAAITDSEVTLYGLDTNDYQGDKEIVNILREMGADVEVRNNGKDGITVRGGSELTGMEIDCSDLPDAIPILSVLGCKAKGKTVLTNLGASKLKETDRSASIKEELSKMGARIEIEGDTMTIYQSDLQGTYLDGHDDHRIVMATSVAGLIAKGVTVIDGAEYTAISFPNFYEVMTQLGADIERLKRA
ncbi:MAG: 3-phosphoshikimate 1-carboxyvinyltransferase [Halanaerobiales bacterium]|nr:3-phosphoshikimate 1-carboxyvinyltransferase [Halanaerobiales bacterium]